MATLTMNHIEIIIRLYKKIKLYIIFHGGI